jgi:hypothetical protein
VQVIGSEELYTVADERGGFNLQIPEIDSEIQLNIRSIGYWEKVIDLDGSEISSLTIVLKEKEFELQEIVVTSGKAFFTQWS